MTPTLAHELLELRDLGDALTGVETSEALHALIGGGS